MRKWVPKRNKYECTKIRPLLHVFSRKWIFHIWNYTVGVPLTQSIYLLFNRAKEMVKDVIAVIRDCNKMSRVIFSHKLYQTRAGSVEGIPVWRPWITPIAVAAIPLSQSVSTMQGMHKSILPQQWSLQLSKDRGPIVHDDLKFLVRKVPAHLELPEGQHAPRKIDCAGWKYQGLPWSWHVSIPSISGGMDKFSAPGSRTIISIVLFRFKVELLFLAHLDMWSISSKMVDDLTDEMTK